MSGQPVFVMNAGPERQNGRKAQLSNISAAKVRHILKGLSMIQSTNTLLPLPYTDSSRRHSDMLGTKSDVEDDFGSYGRNPAHQ